MEVKEIADKLVAYCRKGDFRKALMELYADDAVSIEPHATPDFEKETKGKKNLIAKSDKWNSMVEKMSSATVSDPVIAGNLFACTMNMEVTTKNHGDLSMNELCIYHVKDGKIISEQFMM